MNAVHWKLPRLWERRKEKGGMENYTCLHSHNESFLKKVIIWNSTLLSYLKYFRSAVIVAVIHYALMFATPLLNTHCSLICMLVTLKKKLHSRNTSLSTYWKANLCLLKINVWKGNMGLAVIIHHSHPMKIAAVHDIKTTSGALSLSSPSPPSPLHNIPWTAGLQAFLN